MIIIQFYFTLITIGHIAIYFRNKILKKYKFGIISIVNFEDYLIHIFLVSTDAKKIHLLEILLFNVLLAYGYKNINLYWR